MNRTVREIYQDYRYELVKVGLALEDLSVADISAGASMDDLLERAERLEALIDLYAYLVACQGHGQHASS
jgi:hypothetical protein